MPSALSACLRPRTIALDAMSDASSTSPAHDDARSVALPSRVAAPLARAMVAASRSAAAGASVLLHTKIGICASKNVEL